MRYLPALALFLGACGSTSPEGQDHYYFDKTEHKHAAAWSYDGVTGPEHWGDLSPRYHLAKDGKRQSPINIDTTLVKATELPKLIFRYKRESPVIVNNGHTLQHNDPGNSELEVGGKHYRLEQFHMHAPSEHTIDGRHLPLELHFVHRAANGEIAVVAVFYEEGESSLALKLITGETMPDQKGEETRLKQPLLPEGLLPVDAHYYTYSGSFTTPPCTEDVRWFLLTQPFEASGPLLRKLAEILKGNNRPVQALKGRTVRGH